MVRGTTASLSVMCLALAIATGCSRQATIQAATSRPSNTQLIPFEQAASTRGGISPTASLGPADVPAGTLLTIRLQAPVSSASAQDGDSFEAVLDAPLEVQGQVVAPAGTSVSGKVVSAKPSGSPDDPGYLRLTLTAISLRDRKQAMQTSSLFAKAGSPSRTHPGPAAALIDAAGPAALNSPADRSNVEIPANRKLSFRLTRAMPLHAEATARASE